MGSIAFVMAEYTGISYLSICKAALLPAVLYYLSLFTMIHFEALRHGLGGTPPDLIPELRSIKRKLYYLAPLALLIVLMIAGRSIIFSALLACAAVVALSFLSPETRLTPARFLAAMENAAANLLMIAACCACVGIVIGVVTMTGFGFSFVNLMGSLAQVHIGIFLLVLAGTCVIFGMGLPSLPAYILVATFGAPALVQAGVPVLAAHLFVMYFAISSGITPPVCLVAYAGAAIADAPPMASPPSSSASPPSSSPSSSSSSPRSCSWATGPPSCRPCSPPCSASSASPPVCRDGCSPNPRPPSGS